MSVSRVKNAFSGIAIKSYAHVMAFPLINGYRLSRLKRLRPLKLNVGCGRVRLPGWANLDIEPFGDAIVDLRKRIPFDDDTVDFIYNEHVLEHLSYEEGARVLKEFYRCLKPGGILRIAMPDLDYAIGKYDSDWKNQDWLTWPGHEFITTRGMMINVSFRWWGHKYLYNEEDLGIQLKNAGFGQAGKCELKKSDHPELRNLETRPDSKLIMEARK